MNKMNKKNLSSFGFIVELLDISVTEIADRIYVTQSLVSKWKNGVRSLKKSSEYYEKVISYFIAQNEKNGQKTLENLFSTLYAQEDAGQELYLHNCLHKFLSNEDVPVMARSLFYETRQNLYNSSISVFIGKEGRKSAFSMLMDAAENMEPGEIDLLEREQFSWLLDDPDYMEQWREQMLHLLGRGFHINIVHFISHHAMNTFTFTREFHSVIFHKNVQEFFFHYYADNDSYYSHYLLKGQMSIMGLNPDEKDEQMYTAIYRDPFSMVQHEKLIEKIQRHCTTVFKIYSGNHIQFALDRIKSYEAHRELIFYSGSLPSFCMMDEELLSEVLKSNGVSGKARNRCVMGYKIMRRMLSNSVSRQFYSLESIRRFRGFEEIPYYALSQVAEKPISLTQDQYRRHLCCAADFIDKQPDLGAALTTYDDEMIEPAAIWCKENLWSFVFDNEKTGIAKFGEEPIVVNTMVSILRKQWENLPAKYRTREKVTEVLRGAAQ